MPCDRLSRSPRRVATPATTTGPPPHPRPSVGNGPAHHRTGCPAARATADGSHVHHTIDRSGRRPALLRQHRHAYAAGFQRGLPTGTGNPASELTRPMKATVHALHTGPYPPGLSRLDAYGASTTGSLSLHLLTLLDGPAPSGSPGTSRRCRGCLPPSPAFPGSDCPQLHQTAATAQRRRSSTSTRLRSASWRTPAPSNSDRLPSKSEWQECRASEASVLGDELHEADPWELAALMDRTHPLPACRELHWSLVRLAPVWIVRSQIGACFGRIHQHRRAIGDPQSTVLPSRVGVGQDRFGRREQLGLGICSQPPHEQ
ncbi:hypothetical protein SSAG_01072 [Streptomyces sp. Mg1]|nr:hypothetical protein SSAG_01072 [Streptomyces sp. Mg1]